MLSTLTQIAPVFLIVFLGLLFGLFNKNFDLKLVSSLNRYAYYIGFPSIVIYSFLNTSLNENSIIESALLNFGILLLYLILLIISLPFILRNKKLENTYLICVLFGNVAYLGFPLLSGVFPNSETLLSLLIAGYLLLIFTLLIIKLEVDEKTNGLQFFPLIKKLILNPLLLSCIIGISLMLFKIQLPPDLNSSIEMLSKSASPVVLFALGVFIAKNKIDFKAIKHASYISFIKLLGLPALFLLIAMVFSIQQTDINVSLGMATMPVAITPFVLAEIYNLDKKIIVNAIIISTALSLVSISCWLNFILS